MSGRLRISLWWSFACLLILLAALVVGCAITWFFREYSELGFEAGLVSVSGQVVDDETGDPIPRARVIVTYYRSMFIGSEQAQIGVETNETGHYMVEYDSTFPVRSVAVEASSPTNGYALLRIGNAENLENVELRVEDLPVKFLKNDEMKYDRFRGDLGYVRSYDSHGLITFEGEGR